MFRSIAFDQCSLAGAGYFTGMSNDESEAKAKAMIAMDAAGGPTKVPPPAVSTAAWPRTGSVLAFIAGNCGECEQTDICDSPGLPNEACENLTPVTPKKIG
ncbi:MAG: hypothetical protein KIT48_01960 [Pseudolabrys sp.]|nr:hypothetical protein [Pseudolabrys sp.]